MTTAQQHHQWTKKRGISHSHTHPPVCSMYSSTTAVVLQQKQYVQRTASYPQIHPPNHPPCTAAQQHVKQQRSLLQCSFFTISREDGSFRRSPHVELGVGMHSRTTAAVLQQKQHLQHPNQRPTMYVQQCSRTYGSST